MSPLTQSMEGSRTQYKEYMTDKTDSDSKIQEVQNREESSWCLLLLWISPCTVYKRSEKPTEERKEGL